MKLYNKSQRNFQLANDVIIKPGDFFEVEKEAGEKLLALYSGEIVDSGAMVTDNKANDKLAKVEAELADARKEIETLTTEKAKVEAELEKLKKKLS